MTVAEEKTMYAIQDMNHKLPAVSLRDLFAMNALSFLAGGNWNGTAKSWTINDSEFAKDVAKAAYKIADAMLEARKMEK